LALYFATQGGNKAKGVVHGQTDGSMGQRLGSKIDHRGYKKFVQIAEDVAQE